MPASLDGSVGTPSVTAARPGAFLGSVLAGRVDEISKRVLLMWRDRSPAAASAATSRVEDDIRWTTSLSTSALVEYLLHGESQSREHARARVQGSGLSRLAVTVHT